MKILFIASDNYAASGAFLSMATLNNILNTKYNIQTLVILPCKGDGKDILDRLSVRYRIVFSCNWCIPLEKKRFLSTKIKVMIKKIINFFSVIRLVYLIKKEKVEIVHINTSYSYVGAIAAKLCRIPVIWHLREFLEEDQSREIWNKEKGYKLIGQSDKIIAISQSIYKKYIQIFSEDKLCTILNGIDKEIFYISHRKLFTNKKIVISILGTISPAKGQWELVEAISKMKDSDVDKIEVWIIGKGKTENEKELEVLIARNNLDNVICMQGYQKNISEWLKKTDIVAVCSKSEAFGRVTVEAMLSGCLVIGADTAGTRELIKDHETGLLYHSGDVEQLANVISEALTQKGYMEYIASKGQKFMLENMTAEINAEKILMEYQKLLEDKKRHD